jgi:choline dehydrogenase-like flavoprotein
MAYATVEDVQARTTRTFSEQEVTVCTSLLEDAAVLIDAYNAKAEANAKKVVSCNAVLRALGNGSNNTMPMGATQGSLSALGYSESWTMGSGSIGEIYLSRTDKKMLKAGCKIGFSAPAYAEEEA